MNGNSHGGWIKEVRAQQRGELVPGCLWEGKGQNGGHGNLEEGPVAVDGRELPLHHRVERRDVLLCVGGGLVINWGWVAAAEMLGNPNNHAMLQVCLVYLKPQTRWLKSFGLEGECFPRPLLLLV